MLRGDWPKSLPTEASKSLKGVNADRGWSESPKPSGIGFPQPRPTGPGPRITHFQMCRWAFPLGYAPGTALIALIFSNLGQTRRL